MFKRGEEKMRIFRPLKRFIDRIEETNNQLKRLRKDSSSVPSSTQDFVSQITEEPTASISTESEMEERNKDLEE